MTHKKYNKKQNKQKREKLIATFVYDKKVAKSFHKMDYYKSQTLNTKEIVNMSEIKSKLATPKRLKVDSVIEKFKEKAMTKQKSIFRVLTKMRDRTINAIRKGEPLPIHKDIMSIISNRYILIQAYRTIRKNKGTMSPAYPIPAKVLARLTDKNQEIVNKLFGLPDGLNWNIIDEMSILIKNGKYPWGCSRLIFIPKPGTTKQRPITMPPFADKIVQEAIRMVLEAIYEPYFMRMNCSFGFRSGVGVHEAISLVSEQRLTNGLTRAIEGDIEQAYPSLNRNIMLKVLSERIADKQFIKFMKKRLSLQLFDTSTKKYESTFLGIPQGGIDSPYLWNIYLLGLDEFIQEEVKNILNRENSIRLQNKAHGQKGKMRKTSAINPIYQKITRQIGRIKRNLTSLNRDGLISSNLELLHQNRREIRILKHVKRKMDYYDPNRKKLRFLYLRYADDWIILNNAPNSINLEIKSKIAEWLFKERDLTLSESKTNITDIRKEKAHFLGFEITNKTTRELSYILTYEKDEERRVLKRTSGWQITVGPDKTRLINRFFMKAYCDRKGFPKEIPWLSTFDAYSIISRFNSVLEGLANFYAEFCSYPSSLYRWLYIIRWSALKTLACKHHTSIRKLQKIYPDYTTNIYVTLKNGDKYVKTKKLYTEKEVIDKALKLDRHPKIQKNLLKIEKGEFVFMDEKSSSQRTPRIMDEDFLEKINWVNFRTQANLGLPCLACGSPDSEMHHISHIRKMNFNSIDEKDSVTRMQFIRNRRQVPLCARCHDKVHSGEYAGPALKGLCNVINYDNRITAIEGYIIKGQPYEGVPLEEALINKGWELIENKKNNL